MNSKTYQLGFNTHRRYIH